MYPLNAILVGLQGESRREVYSELAQRHVHVETEFVNVAELATRFQNSGEAPRLIIVQTAACLDGEPIRNLRSRFATWPILALTPSSSSASLVLSANRAGADQIVALPVNPKDFAEGLRLIALRYCAAERPPLMVAVTGALPGAGSTMTAANLAAEITGGFGVRTLLVETAIQMGVLALNLDVQPRIRFGDLLADPDHLEAKDVQKALVRVAAGFELLASSADVAAATNYTVDAIRKVLKLTRQLADVVVVDVPCRYDEIHFETLWAADQVVLVCEQSIPAIRTARMMLEAIGRVPSVKQVHVVLNKFDADIPGLTAEKVAKTLGIATVKCVPNDYPSVMTAASAGRCLRAEAPGSSVVAALHDLAGQIMGQQKNADDGRHPILSWMKHALQSFREHQSTQSLPSVGGA